MSVSVYAYGMCVWSTIHRVEGCLPPENGYGEILESWQVPAGEATNGAILMSHWGAQVRLDGALLGVGIGAPVRNVLREHGVDGSHLRDDPNFEGFRDLVLTNGAARAVFGWFRRHSSSAGPRWVPADPSAIARAEMALIDPCFPGESERAAEHCADAGTPYVTLDARHDAVLHRHAAATVLSGEFLREEYPGAGDTELLQLYAQRSPGLIVLTHGAQPLQHGRRGRAPRAREIPPTATRTTIGAGDAFRAGIAHALSQGWPDEAAVDFASRAAAAVCRRGPIAAMPPHLEQVGFNFDGSSSNG